MKKQEITSKDLQALLIREAIEYVNSKPTLKKKLINRALRRLKEKHA